MAPLPVGFPNDSQRLAIVGRTGSGKTQAAVWHLSNRSFDKMPWVAFNTKGDALIDSIPGIRELDLKKEPPRKPGLYVVRPMPHEIEAREQFLWKIWANGETGVYFDEGYMMNKSEAFQAILTQGRSKKIPAIILTQRPVWISRFVWSESDYFQIFTLTNAQDKATVREFVPEFSPSLRLENYCSLYHDVSKGKTILLDPVPETDRLLATFKQRLPRRSKVL